MQILIKIGPKSQEKHPPTGAPCQICKKTSKKNCKKTPKTCDLESKKGKRLYLIMILAGAHLFENASKPFNHSAALFKRTFPISHQSLILFTLEPLQHLESGIVGLE